MKTATPAPRCDMRFLADEIFAGAAIDGLRAAGVILFRIPMPKPAEASRPLTLDPPENPPIVGPEEHRPKETP